MLRQVRTHAYLFAREELDEVQNAVVRLELEFNERRPFIERDLQEIGDGRLAALRTFVFDMLQYEV